ncbi:hypothetical protein [Tenacibaculum discolor]|uniref:hypothetical protein n=1 Tax=Tenacibaculum discolor TaxID=361581 RepID=UPI003F79885D
MMKKIILFILVLVSLTIKAQNYTPLNYSFNGTPTHGIKIKTNLPYANGSQMPTVIIEGYNYSKGKSIGIMLNWYIYNNNFYSYGASSHGAYAPNIKLANENGKVVIFLDSREYYNRFQVRVYAKGMYADDNPASYENWTAVDEALSGTNIVTVPYKEEVKSNIHVEVDSNNVPSIYSGKFINNSSQNTSQHGIYIQVEENGGDLIRTSNNGGTDQSAFTVKNDGNVGIGTSSPAMKLHLDNLDSYDGIQLGSIFKMRSSSLGSNHFVMEKTTANGHLFIRSKSGNLILNDNGGNVGIGTNHIPTGYKLAIAGKTITEEVKVQLQSNWPDYVFSKEYQLPTLQEVEQHIYKKGHLQNIPSAKEVAKDGGIELGEMNRKLLEKIEELTLYTIQQEKSINELKKIVKQQSKQLESLTTKK